jgi:hypothetical protein
MIDAPIAIVRGYDDLLSAARARMAQLDITFATLDAVSGVASGYSAKLLGPEPCKRFGEMSLGAIMGALGLKLAVLDDPEALAQVRDRLVERRLEGPQYRPRLSVAK